MTIDLARIKEAQYAHPAEIDALVAVVEAALEAQRVPALIHASYAQTHKERPRLSMDDQSMASELNHMAQALQETLSASLQPFINGTGNE